MNNNRKNVHLSGSEPWTWMEFVTKRSDMFRSSYVSNVYRAAAVWWCSTHAERPLYCVAHKRDNPPHDQSGEMWIIENKSLLANWISAASAVAAVVIHAGRNWAQGSFDAAPSSSRQANEFIPSLSQSLLFDLGNIMAAVAFFFNMNAWFTPTMRSRVVGMIELSARWTSRAWLTFLRLPRCREGERWIALLFLIPTDCLSQYVCHQPHHLMKMRDFKLKDNEFFIIFSLSLSRPIHHHLSLSLFLSVALMKSV